MPPIKVIPRQSRSHRFTLKLSFKVKVGKKTTKSTNKVSKEIAPREVLNRVRKTLQRIMYAIAKVAV